MHPVSKANHKRNWPARQRGAVAILLTVAMVALLAMGGLALDGGHLMLNKTRLQNAVDAAALSGAKTLSLMYGETGARAAAAQAALETLRLNANAPGNEELKRRIDDPEFAEVKFSSGIYGKFLLDAEAPSDARYVRVVVENYGVAEFFWGLLDAVGPGDLGAKRVAAVAVAGPSPSAPCDVMPLMVCGSPDDDQYKPEEGLFWGYEFGQVHVLKSPGGETTPIGPGNYQLLDLDGTGKADVRDALAGGISKCVGDTVKTEPGVGSGTTAQGFNTRFNEYKGYMQGREGEYPPDVVVYSDAGLSESGGVVSYGGEVVSSNYADLSTSSEDDLYDYNNWKKDYASCADTGSPALGSDAACIANASAERRMLKIVVGDCTGATNGKQTLPVLGVACFYALQPVSGDQGGGGGKDSDKGGGGNDTAKIFGQFVKECNSDGYPGMIPSEESGPQIIQLYKSYVGDDELGIPSNDS